MKVTEKGIWLISDLHGCYWTMRRLLAKLPSNAHVVFCGDLIDRGPHSREVVEYAMRNKIPTVCGNHEHLALHYHKRVEASIYSDSGLWLVNGAIQAIQSWNDGTLPEDPQKWKLSSDVLDWMQALPYYLKYDNLLVSHTGHGKAKRAKTAFGKEEPREMLLWYRDTFFENDGMYRVFGHTQEASPVITDIYAMIDTGAAYDGRGYGKMTAFYWSTRQVVQQTYNESPLTTK